MCNFWSAIVTKNGDVLCDDMMDSHEDIINKYKDKYDLKDDETDPEKLRFARIEITPPNSDVFQPVKKWNFKIDQEIKPKWFTKTDEQNCRKVLSEFTKKAIIKGKKIDSIESGRYWIKDCKIKEMLKNVLIVQMRETSQVGTMENISIAFIPDNGKHHIICANTDLFILEKHK